jgi:DNA-binding NarL/FixJ family response regulator
VNLSVLIVDDHGDFRRSSRALLEADGFNVIGEAVDGAQAIAKARRLRPDVVLLDVVLPDLDGFAAAEAIAAVDDPPAVVLVSSRDASVYRLRLSATPVRGFLAKSELSGAALARLLA